MRREVHIQKLLLQAERDLNVAHQNFLKLYAYEIACFLAQQAVEKFLKALLMKEKKHYLPTHSLVELGKALKVPPDIYNKLAILTPDYNATRYPDVSLACPYEVYTAYVASHKLSLAKEVINWVKGKLRKHEMEVVR